MLWPLFKIFCGQVEPLILRSNVLARAHGRAHESVDEGQVIDVQSLLLLFGKQVFRVRKVLLHGVVDELRALLLDLLIGNLEKGDESAAYGHEDEHYWQQTEAVHAGAAAANAALEALAAASENRHQDGQAREAGKGRDSV